MIIGPLALAASLAISSLPHPDDGDRGPEPFLFDDAIGLFPRSYPRHRDADLQHLLLEIEIPDMNTPALQGRATYRFEPFATPVGEIRLDARGLTISAVTSPTTATRFTHDGRELVIIFDPPVPLGTQGAVIIAYDVNDPPAGLVWTPESTAWAARPAQIHTQGQPECNSYWFPCHDSPNERLETELKITVPRGYIASGNGRLESVQNAVRQRPSEADPSRNELAAYETFHWVQDKPHASYLVTMVVGIFDVVDLGTRSLPMPVYVPQGRIDDARITYARTPEMVSAFEKIFDEPFPWDRYAQLVVWNFQSGGMENTSATTMYDTAIFGSGDADDHSLDSLIAHELAHQWFGDMITCKSWEHVWLNEGWATYAEALWYESQPAPYGGRAMYEATVQEDFDAVVRDDGIGAPGVQGMASNVYEHPRQAFRRAANPYSKGSSFLHMLRTRLGDAVFFAGVHEYLNRFRFNEVETSDFRRVFEDVSGESLEQFFWQWTVRPGIPIVDAQIKWDPDDRVLRASLVQTQEINGDNPAFSFPLKAWVQTGPGNAGRWWTIEMDGSDASAELALDAAPRFVALNADLGVLCSLTISQPADWWQRQLVEGPTQASRVQAIRAIGTDSGLPGSPRLLDLVFDRSVAETLRIEAIKALGTRHDAQRVETALVARLPDWKVRRTAIESAAEVAAAREDDDGATMRERFARSFSRVAKTDRSLMCRAAAITALGTIKAVDRADIILEASELDSQDDRLRQASIAAMAKLDLPEGLDIALALSEPGRLTRTREIAAKAVGTLGKHDPVVALDRLAELLYDREVRARRGAIEGILELGIEEGLGVLDLFEAVSRSEEDIWRSRTARQALEKKLEVQSGESLELENAEMAP